MKFTLTSFCSAIATLALSAQANTTVLLDEDFNDISEWTDISPAVVWTGSTPSGSMFDLSSGELALASEALQASMWGAGGIRSFSAIDFPFPQVVSHRDNTVTIEFRLRFHTVDQRGESNRVAIMLLHDYPAGGVDTTPELKVGDFSQPWFGRPAYQARIRGGFLPSDAAPYLMYGGGLSSEGEFETQKDGSGNPLYWLPGFVSAAGGTSPGGSPTGNYPLNSWVMGTTAPASTTYKRYRYVVAPYEQSLWVDDDDDGVGFVNILSMPLPEFADRPLSPEPPLYNYFEGFEALRIYFRGAGTGKLNAQAWFDDVKITVEGSYGSGGSLPPPALTLESSGSQPTLEFFAASGYTYQVESASQLGGWAPFGAPVNGNDALASMNLTAPAAGDQVFFRLQRTPNP